jgi:hypothetical protein
VILTRFRSIVGEVKAQTLRPKLNLRNGMQHATAIPPFQIG